VRSAELSRAKVHRDVLDADVKAFRDREPHDWISSLSDHPSNPSLAVVTFRIKVKEESPSEWGLIVGDILTNLRAALDHAVVGHAAGRQHLTEEEERKLNFPILLNSDQWLGAPAVHATPTTPAKKKVDSARKKLVNYLDTAVLDVIEKYQPYQHTPPGEHGLAVLNSLVNQDKHRAVRVVSYVHKNFDVDQADFEVVNIDAPPTPMTDGATADVLHVRRPQWKPGQKKHRLIRGEFHAFTEYGKRLDIPSAGFDADVRGTMNFLVDQVEKVLNDLKAAGC
jgi:hypothetical protein